MYFISNDDGEIHNSKDVLCNVSGNQVEVLKKTEAGFEVIDTCVGYERIIDLIVNMDDLSFKSYDGRSTSDTANQTSTAQTII